MGLESYVWCGRAPHRVKGSVSEVVSLIESVPRPEHDYVFFSEGYGDPARQVALHLDHITSVSPVAA